VGRRVGLDLRKNLLAAGIRSPDRPARSLLHRLRYPGLRNLPVHSDSFAHLV
jgi:hypothetical protein